MAGRGAVADPNADRPRSPFGWVELPADGREGPIPDLPDPPPWMVDEGGWPVATRAAWKRLWETPQATQWDQDGTSLHGWALQHASMAIKGVTSAGLGELRQVEDRHGLNPKALQTLRWRIAGTATGHVAATAQRSASSADRQAHILRLVTGNGAEKKKTPGRPKARKD